MERGLSLARGVDQRAGKRFGRGLVAPQHELERGIEPVAFLDRGFDPESPAYNYTSLATLSELNTLLGL